MSIEFEKKIGTHENINLCIGKNEQSEPILILDDFVKYFVIINKMNIFFEKKLADIVRLYLVQIKIKDLAISKKIDPWELENNLPNLKFQLSSTLSPTLPVSSNYFLKVMSAM
ncbi:hypothetical protein BpHYR1_001998 [Brachionus plicatilis]|uniref:Uncharacterized protein n=1 Tax=Brachionus plicatilis TaxID=10195 RepID=A0A3M7QEJ4_BRAPC|nr:hypothetical protein BpHYR1_001998 [Brachionus plicatilis]